MSSFAKVLVSALALTFMGCAATYAAVDPAQAKKDWAQARDFDKEFEDLGLRSANFDNERGPLKWAEGHKSWYDRFNPWYADFKKKYGDDRQKIEESFKGIDRPLEIQNDIGNYINTLAWAYERDPKEAVKDLLEKGKELFASVTRLKIESRDNADLKIRYARNCMQCFQAAKLLNPTGDYAENLGKAEELYKATKAEVDAYRATLTWKGNPARFQGPGTPDELVAAARDYLARYPDSINWDAWKIDAANPLAVCLTSEDWYTFQKDILGNPTQFTLDFDVAYPDPADPSLAVVFQMTFYTKNEGGVAKAPPYDRASQAFPYRMLASNVPGGGGGSTTSGGMGRLFWLALIAANLVAGLLCAAPFVNQKVPALKSLYDALTPVRNLVGVAALAIGAVAFLRTALFNLAPLADLLPQLAVMVAGLFLGKELLMKKPAAAPATPAADPAQPAAAAPSAAPGAQQVDAAINAAGAAAKQAEHAAEHAAEAAQDLLIKHKAKLEELEQRFQIPVGLACMVLGVLHLLIGGWKLF